MDQIRFYACQRFLYVTIFLIFALSLKSLFDPKLYTTDDVLIKKISTNQIQYTANESRYQHDVTNGDLLLPTVVPNTVYYVWCEERIFTFQHYISMLSVIRFMRPDNIIFLYEHKPLVDTKFLYNTWFDELRSTFPIISMISDNTTCKSQKTPTLWAIMKLIGRDGGVYMTVGTTLSRSLDLNKEFDIRWNMDTTEGYIMTAPGRDTTEGVNRIKLAVFSKCPVVTFRKLSPYTTRLDLTYKDTVKIQRDGCVTIDGLSFPKDFWVRDDYLGYLVRTIFYGHPAIRVPKKHRQAVVPNIAHMVWLGGGEMDFLFYLSVLSLVHIQKVERVYIHGDLPPDGENWEQVKRLPQVIYRYRNVDATQIFGTWVGDFARFWQLAHFSDVIRTEIMLKWGGIYIDTDAIFVRKLADDIMKYDTVTHYSFAHRDPYPDSFVNGFMVARPGAEFFVRFLQTMRHYLDSNWMYNGLLAPYKIMERYPYLVHIEPHIEVVCLLQKCHPTWIANYSNIYVNHLNSGSLPDWKNDANVYHFCSDTCPDELRNASALAGAPEDSMFAQMGRFILQSAGLKY